MLLDTEIFAAAEQQPTRLPEDLGAALALHPVGFLGTDVVQCKFIVATM